MTQSARHCGLRRIGVCQGAHPNARIVNGVNARGGDGERRYGGGNSEQTIIVETNIHGGDLHEIDKNDRTQKTVSKTDQKRSKKWLLGFF